MTFTRRPKFDHLTRGSGPPDNARRPRSRTQWRPAARRTGIAAVGLSAALLCIHPSIDAAKASAAAPGASPLAQLKSQLDAAARATRHHRVLGAHFYAKLRGTARRVGRALPAASPKCLSALAAAKLLARERRQRARLAADLKRARHRLRFCVASTPPAATPPQPVTPPTPQLSPAPAPPRPPFKLGWSIYVAGGVGGHEWNQHYDLTGYTCSEDPFAAGAVWNWFYVNAGLKVQTGPLNTIGATSLGAAGTLTISPSPWHPVEFPADEWEPWGILQVKNVSWVPPDGSGPWGGPNTVLRPHLAAPFAEPWTRQAVC